jgi:hypothetical protein
MYVRVFIPLGRVEKNGNQDFARMVRGMCVQVAANIEAQLSMCERNTVK